MECDWFREGGLSRVLGERRVSSKVLGEDIKSGEERSNE